MAPLSRRSTDVPEDQPFYSTWMFWLAFSLTLTFLTGSFILSVLLYRRRRENLVNADPMDQPVDEVEAGRASKQLLLGRASIASEPKESTDTKMIQNVETDGPLEPSESQVIRDILSGGKPIDWVPYSPVRPSRIGTPDLTLDGSFTLDLPTFETETDITDILSSYMNALPSEDSFIAPVTPPIPNIFISLCADRGPVDPNFEKAPLSPVFVPHDFDMDYLEVPVDVRRSDKSKGSRRYSRSSVTGKQLVLGSRLPKRPLSRLGRNSLPNKVALLQSVPSQRTIGLYGFSATTFAS